MYVTIFDALATQFAPLNRIPRLKSFPPATRALIMGIFIVVFVLLFGSLAVFTSHVCAPLVVLGVFTGVMISKLLTQFLAPRFQTLITGFIGGVTTGNIGAKGASLRTAIRDLGDAIKDLVTTINPGTSGTSAYLDQAIIWSIWIAILTAFVILATNAYYANEKSSPVGNLTK
jgi:hypothetical protein